jgi:serine/threonine-protein kinase
VRQTADGLAHAHEKGMLHRDIKPTNLLVTRPTPAAPLEVKIADFGLPKGPPTAHASAFVAPEVRSAVPGPVDGRADLYSLGCVFYFLLTGRAPDPIPVPLNQLRPDASPEVVGIVHRLLAPYPAMRFTSAAELLAHLDAACVPVALPVDEVPIELPVYQAHAGPDSGGYLTGRYAQPGSGTVPVPVFPTPTSGGHPTVGSGGYPQPGSGVVAVPQVLVPTQTPEPSPWAQLTDEVAEETLPLELDDTPAPIPQKKKAPGHGTTVPVWMTATLLIGIVLLCLMGIGIAVKFLVK